MFFSGQLLKKKLWEMKIWKNLKSIEFIKKKKVNNLYETLLFP
jgi:hypothetical protein